jgi:hypothetical protein
MVYSQSAAENETKESGIHRHPGLFYLAEMGLIMGNEDISEDVSLSLSIGSGYRFGKLAVGAGIGYDNYDMIRMMPIFIRTSYNLNRNAHSPYIFLDTGYSFARGKDEEPQGITYTDVDGGLMIHPGFGYIFAADKVSISLYAGYKIQSSKTSFTIDNWWGGPEDTVLEERTRQRFTLGFNVMF